MDYKLCWSSVMFFSVQIWQIHETYSILYCICPNHVLILHPFRILSFTYFYFFCLGILNMDTMCFHIISLHPIQLLLYSPITFLSKFLCVLKISTGLTYWCYYIQSVEEFSGPLSICILEEKWLVPFKQPSTSNSSLTGVILHNKSIPQSILAYFSGLILCILSHWLCIHVYNSSILSVK